MVGSEVAKNILVWLTWFLVLILILGGTPWQFPANGRYLIEEMLNNSMLRSELQKRSNTFLKV